MRARALLAFLFSTGVMVALTFVPFDWTTWAPEVCRLRNCYCEPFRWGTFVLQPVTSLSNLGYLLAGWMILAAIPSLPHDDDNPMRAHHAFAYWQGIALNITGWFSFLSHASLTRAGEWLDLMGVYQLAGFLTLYNLRRLFRLPMAMLLAIYLLVLAVLGFQMAVAPQIQQICIAVLLGAAGLLEVAARLRHHPMGKNRIYIAALALFAAGAILWGSYGRAPECPPGAFPWHIGWHLLSAAAAGLLFFYYKSEKFPDLTKTL